MPTDVLHDCIIVGGGPAGLSAALVLGRSRRRVLLLDTNRPRNAGDDEIRGFITQEGTSPASFRAQARSELAAYPGVTLRDREAMDVRREAGLFVVTTKSDEEYRGRKLLLATGLDHDLPQAPGFVELFGRSVWTCPYCHGWEHRDEPLAVHARGAKAAGFAVEIGLWSRDVVLCTDGWKDMPDSDRDRLAASSITLDEVPITRLESEGGRLARIHFADGRALPRSGIFILLAAQQASPLAQMLGCEMNAKGTVDTRAYERTNVPGLFVAGDASRRLQFAIVAAAEGAMAAFAINSELLDEDEARRRVGSFAER